MLPSLHLGMNGYSAHFRGYIGVIYAARVALIIPASLHPICVQDMQKFKLALVPLALAVHRD